MASRRKYDVVVWGATGFTGRLVAEFYLKQYGVSGGLKWAMAGRSQNKLEQVRAELGNNDIPLIVADSHDKDSLDAMVKQAKVICTTVGPYAKYGNELVASCVENGTDYCDLAGESQWIYRMIEQHNEKAKENGVRIVHCCGFDSIPSDLGVYYLQNKAKEEKGEYCNGVKLRVKTMKGGFSGGTLASISNLMDEANKDPQVKRIIFNPYGLNPKGQQKGPDKGDLQTVKYDKDAKSWIMPFVMEGINSRVVRRSHALTGFKYGEDFRYGEAMLTGDGLSGRVKAIGGLVGMGALLAGKPGSIYRNVVDRFLPDPGEGPSREERENGFYDIRLIGLMKDGGHMTAKVTGDRDPGYGSTSKMLGEAAVCLAKDKKKCPDESGVTTPSIAMGDALIERLEANAGLTFSIV